MDVPLSARVLSNGVPLSGRTVNFQILSGSGILSLANVNSDSKGYVNTSVHLAALAADVQLSACVEPGDRPCQTYYLASVAPSLLKLDVVAGESQMVASGQSFQPVTYRVTNSAVPGDPVRAASVGFTVLIERPQKDAPVIWVGDGIIGRQRMPVILGSSQSTATSDGNGLVTLVPSTGGFIGPLVLQGTALAGTTSASFELQSFAVVQNGTHAHVGPDAPVRAGECNSPWF